MRFLSYAIVIALAIPAAAIAQTQKLNVVYICSDDLNNSLS